MGYVVLYFGALLVGYLLGGKLQKKAEEFGFLGRVQTVCIFFMVFIMGARMGSNEEIINNLGTIGLKAFVITIGIFIGSALSVTISRKFLGIDKWGNAKHEDIKENKAIEEIEKIEALEEAEEQGDENAARKTTMLILIAVTLGLLAGYFIVRPTVTDIDAFYDICSRVMTTVLTLMLFVIGLDMGLEGTVVAHMKDAGWKILVFPFTILVGTTLVGVLSGLFIPGMSLKTGLAVCYGYGWYTFAPIAIASEGYITASAISFMHNVFRELLGIILIPVLAKHIGYIEVCSLPGTAGSDIAMPVITRSTRPDIVVYSFTMGIICTLFVPVLVPLVIGM